MRMSPKCCLENRVKVSTSRVADSNFLQVIASSSDFFASTQGAVRQHSCLSQPLISGPQMLGQVERSV